MKNNIILIGMPGCGKSTVGVLLAKILGFAFIDSDLLIQQAENKKLYEIINENGAEYFKAAENRVNASIDVSNTVIATGGSVVYCEEAMAHLKSIGTVVYIKITPKQLLERINNIATRGVVIKNGETLIDLYNERAPLYEKYADIMVESSDDSLIDNAQNIANMLNNIF
ncbi:MAG: shikimate kinase [Ruminococcaceae bacterium]|nr:shikimate kinase [Oscillospiraceae bacterium]